MANNLNKMAGSLPSLLLLSFIINVQGVAAADSTIGSGTIAIMIMIGVSFFICLFSRGTTSPLFVSMGGALLPILSFIFVYLFPKETNSTDKSQDSRICCDDLYIVRILFLVILIIGTLLGILWRAKRDVFTSHYARKAASGYKQKEQDEINRQKQFLKLMKEQGDEDQQALLNEQENADRDFSKNAGPDFRDPSAPAADQSLNRFRSNRR